MVALPIEDEKSSELLLSTTPQPDPFTSQTELKHRKFIIALRLILVYIVALSLYDVTSRVTSSLQENAVWNELATEGRCPVQPDGLQKGKKWEVPANYSRAIAEKLSKAVQIATVSYDNMGDPTTDSRFDIHNEFSAYLEATFPHIYSSGKVKHEFVNKHAHLFTLPGTNPSLQPILLMAHTDVVPVNPATLNQWTHPPFEGKIDDTWIWGRGAADCKNQLMGIMNALEKLLEEGWVSERTILVQFGFDEEIGGTRGATSLERVIRSRYGTDSLAFLVDEGFGGVDEAYGATFASFGMAEKGSTNFQIIVETPGGHSSVPPEHTGIGLMSQIIVQMEANPFPIEITPKNPYVKYLNCLAEHAPDLPDSIRSMILNPKKWKKLAKTLTEGDQKQKAFLGTTQALDLISGGVKVNALPEQVVATVNHRISFTSSIAETKAHVAKVIAPKAEELGIEFVAFGENLSSKKTIKNASGRKVTLQFQPAVLKWSPIGGLEPAPITSEKAEAFELMAGTLRNIWPEAIAAPSGMYANTDTRNYWSLTRNLYRFLPISTAEFRHAHTVDESVPISGHTSTVRFFYTLLQNLDGWRQGTESA